MTDGHIQRFLHQIVYRIVIHLLCVLASLGKLGEYTGKKAAAVTGGSAHTVGNGSGGLHVCRLYSRAGAES